MFNAAGYFIDRHIEQGRGASIAVECADRRLTYRDVFEQVNRVGNALKTVLEVRPEERVLLVMCEATGKVQRFKLQTAPVPENNS
jgi:benzoate-CoA ligase